MNQVFKFPGRLAVLAVALLAAAAAEARVSYGRLGQPPGYGDVIVVIVDPVHRPRPESLVWDLGDDKQDITSYAFLKEPREMQFTNPVVTDFVRRAADPGNLKYQVLAINYALSKPGRAPDNVAVDIGLMMTLVEDAPRWKGHANLTDAQILQPLRYWLRSMNEAGIKDNATLSAYPGDPFYFYSDYHQDMVARSIASATVETAMDFWYLQQDPTMTARESLAKPLVNRKLGRFHFDLSGEDVVLRYTPLEASVAADAKPAD